MNSAPRFETIEIHDADLDSISDLDAFVSAKGVSAHASADVVLG